MKKLLTIGLLLCYNFVSAQIEAHANVVPPSPNAASLGQYGDFPVSTYTGVPSIDIQLYTVKSGKIRLPISLNYHASGIRVAQEASWAGLGWSINAGGVITRQLRGLEDFDDEPGVNYTGYVTGEELPASTYDNTPLSFLSTAFGTPSGGGPEDIFYDDVRRGLIDGEPDIYYYNFLGYSGKLAFRKQSGLANATFEATPLKQNNMKFYYTPSTRTWEVVDGNGWKFFFGTTEITKNHSQTDTSNYIYDVEEINVSNSPNFIDHVSAWYIDKIETPDGDMVTFEYDTVDHRTISQVSFSQVNMIVRPNVDIEGNIPRNRYSASMQEVDDVYLSRINFKNGYISFNTDNREDMRVSTRPYITTPPPLPQRIQNFEVFNSNSKRIKKVDFSHSYFYNANGVTNPENLKRLRLDEVVESYFDENTQAYQSKPPYKFTYDGTEIPKKNSFLHDSWGYNNSLSGSSSQITYRSYTLIDVTQSLEPASFPTVIVVPPLTTTEVSSISQIDDPVNNVAINGVNRKVDPIKIQAGMLKAIKYPTGGSTSFTYEPNEYESNGTEEVPFSVTTTDYVSSSNSQRVASFTLDEPTTVKLDFTAINLDYESQVQTNSLDPGIFQSMVAVLRTADGNEIISYRPTTNPDYINAEEFYQSYHPLEEFQAHCSVILPAGNYEIETDNLDKDNVAMELIASFFIESDLPYKLGGGVRIASIETKDKGQTLLTTKYGYSGGQLLTPIATYYVDGVLFAMSGTVIPLATSAQGNPVGYNAVTVSKIDGEDNSLGSVSSAYRNEVDWPNENYLIGTTLPGVPTSPNLTNGMLIAQFTHNSSGTLVKSSTFTPELYDNPNVTYEDEYWIRGLQVTVNPYLKNGSFPSGRSRVQFYFFKTQWWYNKFRQDIVYDENGQNPVTTNYGYQYSNPLHKNLTYSGMDNSLNKSVNTVMEYPQDYPTGTEIPASTLTNMIGANIVNAVIKQEKFSDGVKVEGAINNYKAGTNHLGNDMYVMDNGQTLKRGTTAEYEPRTRFNRYDNYGNPLEILQEDGTSTSLIWGYNQEYPIAKIENANRDLIDNLPGFGDDFHSGTGGLSIALETTLRTHASLQNAMITTYTYEPLIGVTSMTDPKGYTIHFEYDTYNRLKEVKDADGNVVTDYDYHYRGQTN